MAATEKNVEAIKQARTVKDVPWCEEYEAMISGMTCASIAFMFISVVEETNHRSRYRSWESAQLEKGRSRALSLCNEYNQIQPSKDGVDNEDALHKRNSVLQSLLGGVQGTATIEPPFSVLYGCNTFIGRNFYGNTG